MSNPRIVVVGGGTAGITVSARLLRASPNLEITIIEPNDDHYYQPMWTLIGAGIFPREKSARKESRYIPHGATWVRDHVETFDPGTNSVSTRGGKLIGYDYLVVCPGMQLDWTAIKGLSKEIVGTNGICSNYSFETVATTWQMLKNFSGGTALFTHPACAIKCGGAPAKICFLAEDHLRRTKIRDHCQVIFAVGMPRIFAVDRYARTLEDVVERRGIEVRLQHDLVEIRPVSKECIFQVLDSGECVTLRYDMIHVTPKMGPPDFVASSPLSGEGGWVSVDKYTTQHTRYSNIFSLGDCSSLPTSKTGAAIRKQAPVTVANILAMVNAKPLDTKYDGYTSCPLVTGYRSMVLAEFDYDKNSVETFPFDQSKERYSMFLLKKYGLPYLYWHVMLRGRG